MKIAIIVGLFPPITYAGTEIATYYIATYFAARGHDVHVMTGSGAGLVGKSQENGFNIYRIHYPKVRLFGGIVYWARNLFLIRQIDPEIILCQSMFSGLGGLFSKICFGKSYVVWGQGSDIYLPTTLMRIFAKIILRNADASIALTEDMKREMENVSHKSVYVIPNGIQVDEFENLFKDKIRNDLKIEKDQMIILFVGRLHPIKGLKYLLDAFKSVIEAGFHVALVIVGDGEERAHLQRITADLNLQQQVYFIGGVDKSLVPEYMAGADIFVLPSLSEGFGIVLLEAMASGLPIITTNVGGIPEVIDDNVNGFIVEPKNPSQLAQKLVKLLSEPELRSEIANNNIKKAKQYDWHQVIYRIEYVFNLIVNERAEL